MFNRPSRIVVAATAMLAAPGIGFADVVPHAGMLKYPDIGPDSIVFVYANNLWVVDRAGGQAAPLASPPGAEGFPRFSADGETIAFMGNYDGNRDLYTVPVAGGVPHRVTHHPSGEVLCDWTPDGRLLFYAAGITGMPRQTQLFTVGAEGGLPEKLPLPYGAAGAVGPDGTWLAYTPHTRDFRTWKRYRGGMATDIWLFNLETRESRRITEWEGTDTLPMWHGETLYYLSDRGGQGKLNIWRYDVADDEHEQVTRFRDFDVKWPSLGPGRDGEGEIIFQNGSGLQVLDLSDGTTRSVAVTIPGARPTIRPKRVDASEFTRWWHISSKGKRALVEARGDIWTLPAEHGAPRNLTRTSGAAEREASWSPDGRWIAYFSDATGEYELYVTQSDGKGETKQLTTDSETYYYDPAWSPDSGHIVFADKAARYYLHTIESGETRMFDQDPWGQRSRPSWSHDSRWLTYARTTDDRPTSSVWLYDVETGDRHEVTSGVFSDAWPVFDRQGDYIYLTSRRVFGSPRYSEVDTTWVYTKTGVLLAVPLREDVETPWPPESDEETWDEDEDDDEGADDEDGDGDEGDDEDEGDEPAAGVDDGVSGQWEGVANTPDGPIPFTLTLVLRADNTVTGSLSAMMYSGRLTGTYDPDAKTLSLTVTVPDGPVILFDLTVEGDTLTGTAEAEGEPVDIDANRTAVGGDDGDDGDEEGEAEEEDEDVAERVEIELEGFEERAIMLPVPPGTFRDLSVNDKNQLIYVRSGDGEAGIKIFDLEDDKKEEKTIVAGVNGYEISGDGKKLIALRGGGPTIHKTAAGDGGKRVVTDGMIAHIDPREEWKQIFQEAWRLQRDFFYVSNMHGVDWPAMRERYGKMVEDCVTRNDLSYVIREMIAELNIGHAYYFGGDVEDEPSVSVGMLGVDWALEDGAHRLARIYEGAVWDVDARSPLRQASEAIEAGDYLLAVNGTPVDPNLDPWAAFEGTAGRTITVTVSAKPVMDEEARTVVIKPVPSEGRLRYRAWIEANRAYVDEQTGGKVGYIYVPDTGINGQNDLVRQYYGQAHKAGLIIDERWNGGGQIPTRFIEMLNRPVTNYWARRDGKDSKWPPDAHHGPKCMLINGLAGSGGDMFPWLFRQAGLGPLIGTRTWGGLVGISGNPSLIDGGVMTVPTFGFYEKDGTWGVEGHGVDPDMEVIDDPALMVDGGDPQLDAAIAHILQEIEKSPYAPPRRPTPPDRSGMGIREEDK